MYLKYIYRFGDVRLPAQVEVEFREARRSARHSSSIRKYIVRTSGGIRDLNVDGIRILLIAIVTDTVVSAKCKQTGFVNATDDSPVADYAYGGNEFQLINSEGADVGVSGHCQVTRKRLWQTGKTTNRH